MIYVSLFVPTENSQSIK